MGATLATSLTGAAGASGPPLGMGAVLTVGVVSAADVLGVMCATGFHWFCWATDVTGAAGVMDATGVSGAILSRVPQSVPGAALVLGAILAMGAFLSLSLSFKITEPSRLYFIVLDSPHAYLITAYAR